MQSDKEILAQIKAAIQEIIPDAKVYLFGSRARGDWHEESDWDILVLTEKKYPKAMKWQLHDRLFPLSVEIASLINVILEQKNEWFDNAGYYALRLNVEPEKVEV